MNTLDQVSEEGLGDVVRLKALSGTLALGLQTLAAFVENEEVQDLITEALDLCALVTEGVDRVNEVLGWDVRTLLDVPDVISAPRFVRGARAVTGWDDFVAERLRNLG